MSVRSNFENFLEYLGEAIILVDSNAIIEFANRTCLELFGFHAEEFFGQSINIVVEPEHRKKHANLVKHYVRARSEPKRMMSRSTLNCITKSGHQFVVRVSISTIDIDGSSYGIAIVQDYTATQKWADDIEHKAITDSLTLLYNRHYLDTILAPDNRWFSSRKSIAILYLDLDDFKPLNDQYGHAFGDFILKNVAQRMKESLRQNDLVFRVGGDEFVIMLTLDDSHNPLCTAKSVAEKLHQEISRPIHFEEGEVSVGVSIGVGLYPHDFDNIEITIKLADKAMYHSKKYGQSITCVSDLPSIIKS